MNTISSSPAAKANSAPPADRFNSPATTTAKNQTCTDQSRFSGLADLAGKLGFSTLSCTRERLQFSVSSTDRSLELRASYDFSGINLKLALNGAGNEEQTGTGPGLRVRIELSNLQIDFNRKTSRHRPLRPPEEILQDLVGVLRRVFRADEKTDIKVLLDEDALASLLQNEEFVRFFQEILMLISVVNALKGPPGSRPGELVLIEGRGRPVLISEARLSIQAGRQVIELELEARAISSTPEPKQA